MVDFETIRRRQALIEKASEILLTSYTPRAAKKAEIMEKKLQTAIETTESRKYKASALENSNQPSLEGIRIVCATNGLIHVEVPEKTLFAFADSSWRCTTGCGERHCSQCFYSQHGDTIVVMGCGRFMEKEEKND